eukprot:g4042.t1
MTSLVVGDPSDQGALNSGAPSGKYDPVKDVFLRINHFISSFTPNDYDATKLEFAVHAEIRGIIQRYGKVQEENELCKNLLVELRQHLVMIQTEKSVMRTQYEKDAEFLALENKRLEKLLKQEQVRSESLETQLKSQDHLLKEWKARDSNLQRVQEAKEYANDEWNRQKDVDWMKKVDDLEQKIAGLTLALTKEKTKRTVLEEQMNSDESKNLMEASLRRRLQVTQDRLSSETESSAQNEKHWQRLLTDRVGEIRSEYDEKLQHYEGTILRMQREIQLMKKLCD